MVAFEKEQDAHQAPLIGPLLSSLSASQSLPKPIPRIALQTLVDVARNGRTDAARVSAANALLDRAYGKPVVNEEREVVDLPPMVIELTSPQR